MNGSVTPPRYVSRFHRRNGVFPAFVQPQGKWLNSAGPTDFVDMRQPVLDACRRRC